MTVSQDRDKWRDPVNMVINVGNLWATHGLLRSQGKHCPHRAGIQNVRTCDGFISSSVSVKERSLMTRYTVTKDYILLLWPYCAIYIRLYMSNISQCYIYECALRLSIDKETKPNKLQMLNDQWGHVGSFPFNLLNWPLLMYISLN
jgi:hypothetical protein